MFFRYSEWLFIILVLLKNQLCCSTAVVVGKSAIKLELKPKTYSNKLNLRFPLGNKLFETNKELFEDVLDIQPNQ